MSFSRTMALSYDMSVAFSLNVVSEAAMIFRQLAAVDISEEDRADDNLSHSNLRFPTTLFSLCHK